MTIRDTVEIRTIAKRVEALEAELAMLREELCEVRAHEALSVPALANRALRRRKERAARESHSGA